MSGIMDTILDFIKDYLIPGSTTFLLIGMLIGVVLLFARRRIAMWGRRWLILLVALYWVLSMPFGARALEAILSAGYTSTDPSALEGAQAIVVLGGGGVTYRSHDREVNVLSDAGIMRALESAHLYHQMQEPWVIVSGGINQRAGLLTPESEALQALLIREGVSPECILVDATSRNTYEQAVNLRPLLEAHDIERFLLVTSQTHMRRSMGTFRAQALDPVAWSAPQHAEGFLDAHIGILPNNEALNASRMAMREIMALTFYSLAGRLSAP
jgi:uncharacterized SAM-binding protein YcdF (DUF218 family)